MKDALNVNTNRKMNTEERNFVIGLTVSTFVSIAIAFLAGELV